MYKEEAHSYWWQKNGEDITAEQAADFSGRYDEILATSRQEYTDNTPNMRYLDGCGKQR